MTALLKLDNVRLKRGSSVPISFEIKPGETVAILGPNGVGKTTLLRVLMGESEILSGTIENQGKEVGDLSPHAISCLFSFVPQETTTGPGLTVKRLLQLGLLARRPLFATLSLEDQSKLNEVVARFKLGTVINRSLDQVSTGEKQRASLARALLQRSECLLLDEPTSHLDPAGTAEFWEELKRVREEDKRAIVFVTHDLNHASRVADRFLLLGTNSFAVEPKLTRDKVARLFQSEIIGLEER